MDLLEWSDVMRKGSGLVISAILLSLGAAHGRPADGKEFYETCARAAKGDAMMRLSLEQFIIGGVETGYNLSKIYKRPRLSCFSEGATVRQISGVFCKYSNDCPEVRQARASILALSAFNRAFPCK